MKYQQDPTFKEPRFSGISTFMRLPHVKTTEDVDVAVVGVPLTPGRPSGQAQGSDRKRYGTFLPWSAVLPTTTRLIFSIIFQQWIMGTFRLFPDLSKKHMKIWSMCWLPCIKRELSLSLWGRSLYHIGRIAGGS